MRILLLPVLHLLPCAPAPAPVAPSAAPAARPAAITPTESPAGAGDSGLRISPPSGPAALPKSYPYMMGRPGGPSGQRSLAEMADEQINGGRRRAGLA